MSASGIGGTGKQPISSKTSSPKRTISLKKRTGGDNINPFASDTGSLFSEAPAEVKTSKEMINPFADLAQKPSASKEKSKPLLDRKEDNVLGNLFREEETRISEPLLDRKEDNVLGNLFVEEKKPEAHPSQMQMVVSQYRPENMQMVVSQYRPENMQMVTFQPKKKGFLSKLTASFKTGLANGMKVAAKGLSSLSQKLNGGADRLQASIKTEKTVESNDVQVMNQDFKNLGSIIDVTDKNIQEKGTDSHKGKIETVQENFKNLSSLIKSLTEMLVKKFQTQSPASGIQDPEPPKIEDITDNKPIQEANTIQSSVVSEKKDTDAVVTEDKKETNLTPESKVLEQFEDFKKVLLTTMVAFMALEKAINPSKSDSQGKLAFDPLNLNKNSKKL